MPWSVTSNPLKFDKAVKWFLGRIPIDRGEFEALSAYWKARAFSIAGVAQLDLIAEVHDSLTVAIKEGLHVREWAQAMQARLEQEWAGTVKNPGWRVETILRVNTQHAYGRGRYQQMTDPDVLKARPYWVFDAIIDGDETQICRERDGTTLPADSQWWELNYPPLHYNCRSSVRSLTPRAAQRRGISPEDPAMEHPAQGDFGHAPGSHEWQPDPSAYPPTLWRAWQEKLRRRLGA